MLLLTQTKPRTHQEPPADEDTNILQLPEDCLGLILDHLDPVTVGQLQRTSRHMYNLIETHQYWRSVQDFLLLNHSSLVSGEHSRNWSQNIPTWRTWSTLILSSLRRNFTKPNSNSSPGVLMGSGRRATSSNR